MIKYDRDYNLCHALEDWNVMQNAQTHYRRVDTEYTIHIQLSHNISIPFSSETPVIYNSFILVPPFVYYTNNN